MTQIIKARALGKSYRGVRALDGVSFDVEAGRIVGVIGPNGAGKTTALKAILGLTHFEGELVVMGRNPYTERDLLMRPARTRKLASEHLGRVDLDDDLAVEVPPDVEVQVAVRRPREAVDAGVRAAAVGVHRPAERHRRALGDAIEHRACTHLVEAHVERLGRVEGPHHRVVAVPRQPVCGLPLERQVRPPHTNVCSHAARTDSGGCQTSAANCR